MESDGLSHPRMGYHLLQLCNAVIQCIPSGSTTAFHRSVASPLVIIQDTRRGFGDDVEKEREVVPCMPEMFPYERSIKAPVWEAQEIGRRTYRGARNVI